MADDCGLGARAVAGFVFTRGNSVPLYQSLCPGIFNGGFVVYVVYVFLLHHIWTMFWPSMGCDCQLLSSMARRVLIHLSRHTTHYIAQPQCL